METDLGMQMGALGVKGQVLDGSNPSGIGVNVKSDAMWVRTTSERTEGMRGAEGASESPQAHPPRRTTVRRWKRRRDVRSLRRSRE